MIKDSKERYGALSRLLHWLMALLVIWQVLKFGDRIADGEHWVGQVLVPWHVSIGSLLLVLAIVRVLWSVNQKGRRPGHEPGTEKLVSIGHGLLYALMVLMPLTGVMIMLGGGYGLTAFGVEIIAKSDGVAWAKALGSLHSPLAWAFTAVIAGHIAMALFHQFVRRDSTLNRMV